MLQPEVVVDARCLWCPLWSQAGAEAAQPEAAAAGDACTAWVMDLFLVVGPNLLPLGHGRNMVWTGQQSASHSLRFAHSLSFLLLLSVAKALPARALKPQCLNQSRKGWKSGDEIIP